MSLTQCENFLGSNPLIELISPFYATGVYYLHVENIRKPDVF